MKNVFCISFYNDFTRFFEKFNEINDVKVKIFSCNLSGFFFPLNKKASRIFLPLAVRMNRNQINASKLLNKSERKWIVEYHEKRDYSYKYYEKIGFEYFSYFYLILTLGNPNIVIISGDSRLQSRSAILACKYLNIEYLCFEQGPFNTTYLDKKGVLSNASFRDDFPVKKQISNTNICYDSKKPKKIFILPRILDYVISTISRTAFFREILEEKDILYQIKKYTINKFLNVKKKDPLNKHKYDILLIGQVPTDASFILHNHYNSHCDFVQNVSKLFPNKKLLFREHPLLKDGYDNEFYKLLETLNIKLSKGCTLSEDINRVKHVVTMNSTVGFDILFRFKKTLLCTSDAIYSNLNGVYDVKNKDKFLDSNYISKACYDENRNWLNRNFIAGHFREDNLSPLIRRIESKYLNSYCNNDK